MSLEGKTIDDITRTLTSFNGTERIPGRDDTGDFKATVAALVLYATSGGTINEIDDADETILDTDIYKIYTFDNLTANRALNLPTLADNFGKEIYVINLDGSYDVNVTPEGSDDINDWNVAFPITEKYGILKVIGLSDRWFVTPLNDACIYEVSSETSDTGLAVDGTWDDVSGMTLLNGVYGYGYFEARANQYAVESNYVEYLQLYLGLGTISGNNAPNIPQAYDYRAEIRTDSNLLNKFYLPRHLNEIPYESDGSTIYMKVLAVSNEMNLTQHGIECATNAPMYIRWRRVY
jgi:hypothetical protein